MGSLGESESFNPYLAEFERFFPRGAVGLDELNLEEMGKLKQTRLALVQKFSWAIPSQEALDTIKRFSPVIEIGAGNGYWAWLLRKLGCEVETFDIKPGPHLWSDVKLGTHEALKQFPSSTLFLCWPPYNNSMAAQCLESYSGNCLVYVGESKDLSTGDDRFFEILETEFRLEETLRIPSWPGIHDALFVYRRVD